MSTLTNDSNANATSPTRSASSPPLTNSPPTDPAPNAPSIGLSTNANDIDLATTMDPNIRNNAAASSSGSIGIDGVEEMIGEGPAPPVTMTEAAAIIVAKQRKGAPGVEHDGIHDTAPTPYAESPDVEDEAGKSIGNTSRNNHVDHDIEDGGAHPFDSEEFEDRGVGKKMMTRVGDDPNNTQIIEEGKEEEKEEEYDDEEQQVDHAQDVNEEVEVNTGRPRHEAVMLPPRGPPRSMLSNNNDQRSMLELEATLVPNEPVYDGVPLEPVLAWYRQEKARRFLAFVCLMFMAAVVLFSVLFSRPPSTTTTVILDSPPTPPTNTCFNNKGELRGAITSYIAQDCAQNENCNTARFYGYPMNSWCVGQITDMSGLFSSMSSFDEDISDWDVSSVTSMEGMFEDASAFNGDLSEWDVSSATGMDRMFRGASAFNQDLCAWDVSSVTSMYSMFSSASAFNGDLSDWDVSSVTSMYSMFASASAFNGNLSEWDVSSVTTMEYMFDFASAFNGNLSDWDVSSVTSMGRMFGFASAFNGDLSEWDVSSVKGMWDMFYYASAFNQDLCAWNVSSVKDMGQMFYGASAFNQDLCAWNGTFPYDDASYIFSGSGCTFQDDPYEPQTYEQQGGPFCASSCSE